MYGYSAKVEITDKQLGPPIPECDCHGPYAHPVVVALEHQQARRFREWFAESLGYAIPLADVVGKPIHIHKGDA